MYSVAESCNSLIVFNLIKEMKKYIFLSLAFLLCLTGCKETPEFHDKVFLTGTLSSQNIKFLVDGQSSLGLTVSSSAKANSDVKITVEADPGKLDVYNAATGRTAVLPPADSYSIDGKSVVIEAGKSQSTALEVSADAEKLQEGVAYCLPVSITSVDGDGLGILESSRTAFIVFNKVIEIKAADLNKAASFDILGFGGEDSPVKALSQMTLEMKIKPESFGGISSLCGCEENFLFRFGGGKLHAGARQRQAGSADGRVLQERTAGNFLVQFNDPFLYTPITAFL